MRIVTAIMLAFVTLTIMLAGTAAEAQDCALKTFASFDISLADGIVRVPMSINGTSETVALRLEVAPSGVSEEIARGLGLRFSSLPEQVFIFHDGAPVSYSTRADIQLGPEPFRNFDLLIDPKDSPLAVAGLAGYMGTSLLRALDFDIDIAQHKFNFFLPDHCPGKVVYWTKSDVAEIPMTMDDQGHFTTAMDLDGKPVKVSFQGFTDSWMTLKTAHDLFGLDETSPGMTELATAPSWAPPSAKVYVYKFKTLSADALEIANPTIDVLVEKRATLSCKKALLCFGAVDVSLGTALWSKLHLYFSGKEKRIYITPANAR